MHACQAVFTHFAPRNAANDCASPVLDVAPAVVAHPVVLDGGERTSFAGPWLGPRCIFGLRDDVYQSGLKPEWACGGMDARRDPPSGSHHAMCLGSVVYADGFICRYWA